MTKRSDFKADDRVEHKSMGHGRVTKSGDEYLVVTYDNWKSHGEYNDLWFQNYPNHLKHIGDHQ